MERETVIVAFESDKSRERIRDILESGATASCVLCRTADQVRRAVHKLHITAVVCGFKLADQTAEDLFGDLPPACSMLVVAAQSMLDLCENEDIFRLVLAQGLFQGAALLQMQRGAFGFSPAQGVVQILLNGPAAAQREGETEQHQNAQGELGGELQGLSTSRI